MTSSLVLFTDEEDDEIICLIIEPLPEPKRVTHVDVPKRVKAQRVSVELVNEDTLVEDHLPLVSLITKKMALRLPPHINYDDLYSAGVSGLMAACMKFDREQARKFRGYASMRIRGSILDWLRKLDYAPRRARAAKKKMDAAVLAIEARTLRDATDEEIAAEMGISAKKLEKLKSDAGVITFVQLDSHAQGDESEGAQLHEFLADDNDVVASDQMQHDETIGLMLSKVQDLTPIERRIIRAYYYEGKKLQGIADEFGLTESRICQIHKQALVLLRKTVGLRMGR